jgi:hypothetical protein
MVPVSIALAEGMLGDISGTDWNIFEIIFGSEVFSVFPDGQISTNNILQYLVFPFLAVWMVMYGIMVEIRIFRRKDSINAVLALLMALIASATGGLVMLTRGMFSLFGNMGMWGFGILMFFGIILWAGTRLLSWGAPWTSKQMRRTAMEAFNTERAIGQYRDAYNDYMAAGQYDKAKEMLTEIQKLEEKRDRLRGDRSGGTPQTPGVV